MGYSQGRSSSGNDGNPVGNDLPWRKTGDSGIVCGAAADIQVMHQGDGLLGGRAQERRVVVTRGV